MTYSMWPLPRGEAPGNRHMPSACLLSWWGSWDLPWREVPVPNPLGQELSKVAPGAALCPQHKDYCQLCLESCLEMLPGEEQMEVLDGQA